MNFLTYSNGWGHLIMSVVLVAIGALFILFPGTSSDLHAIGISLVLTVSSAWFIPGAAKAVVAQVQQQNLVQAQTSQIQAQSSQIAAMQQDAASGGSKPTP
jgi:UPF0716 family protein affecting phage T7 exclusion